MSAAPIEVVSRVRFTRSMKTIMRNFSIPAIFAILVFGIQVPEAAAEGTQYCQGMVCTDTPPAPDSNGGFAVVHPDGHVCGVIVGNIAYFGGNNRTMESEYMGCPIGARIIFQTKADPVTGNVAGYHGSSPETSVQYDNATNSFTISNGSAATPSAPAKITLIIKDGIATDSSGRSFSTGNGVSASTTLSQDQYQQLVTETSRIDSAKNQRQSALSQAQILAAQTPGIERCVSWSGYLENGQECAIVTASSDTTTVQTRSVSNSLSTVDSQTVLNVESSTATAGVDSVTITVKAANEYVAPIIKSEAVEVQGTTADVSSLALKIETNVKAAVDIDKSLRKLDTLRKVTASSVIKLPDAKLSKESAISLTPSICSASGIQVSKIGKGLCTIAYTILSEAGNTYTTEKTFSFR
jgi:hypothetical protein